MQCGGYSKESTENLEIRKTENADRLQNLDLSRHMQNLLKQWFSENGPSASITWKCIRNVQFWAPAQTSTCLYFKYLVFYLMW